MRIFSSCSPDSCVHGPAPSHAPQTCSVSTITAHNAEPRALQPPSSACVSLLSQSRGLPSPRPTLAGGHVVSSHRERADAGAPAAAAPSLIEGRPRLCVGLTGAGRPQPAHNKVVF